MVVVLEQSRPEGLPVAVQVHCSMHQLSAGASRLLNMSVCKRTVEHAGVLPAPGLLGIICWEDDRK